MVSFHMAGRMSNKLQARSESVILGEWSPTPFPSLQQIGSFQWLAPFFLPAVARNLGFDQNFHRDDDPQTGVMIPSGRKSKEPVTRELVGGEILSDRESKHWMRVPSDVNNIKHKSDIWDAD